MEKDFNKKSFLLGLESSIESINDELDACKFQFEGDEEKIKIIQMAFSRAISLIEDTMIQHGSDIKMNKFVDELKVERKTKIQKLIEQWQDRHHELLCEYSKGNIKNEQTKELTKKLKDKIVSTYRKSGDKKMLITNKQTYTGNELAKEVEEETDFGVKLINNLLQLTIDLISRDKINTGL